MDSLAIQHLQTLSPALQKLACLYAYVGGPLSDDDRTQLSVHGACMLGELPILTSQLVNIGIVVSVPATHFAPQCEQIRPRYYGDVLLFASQYHPEWLEELDTWPLSRSKEYARLEQSVRLCAAGKKPEPMVLSAALPPMLISLAHDRRFDPLVTMVRDVDFPAFISACIRKWMKEDWTDEEDVLKRQMSIRKFDTSDPDIKDMLSLCNYYIYICQGQYTPPTSIRMNYADLLLKGVHAMTQGKSELAMKVLGDAVTASARTSAGRAEARFLRDGVAAFYWVIAVWTAKRSDSTRRLREFVDWARENDVHGLGASVLLAKTLSSPLQRMDMDMLADLLNPQELSEKEYVLQQRMALLLAANFTGYRLTTENFTPKSSFLRHEGAAYITLARFERKQLTTAFGAKPISSLVKGKEPWEHMLDRLIATESQRTSMGGSDEGEHRVMYIITSDGESVELREQNRLRDGRWGSGKQLPWGRFIGGTEPFMDRTDQAVVADVRYMQAARLTVGIILPHLVGSDRVYTGEHTPYRRVTIESQTPYVILERNDSGFRIQSNVEFQDLISQTNVYHRADELHYIYFPMSDAERATLQELLSVSTLPPEAEDKLRQLLPLVKRTIDIHSDLIEEDDRELPKLDSQSAVVVCLTPDPTAQTYFDALLHVCPLAGGHITVTPAQGDTAIIDQSEFSQGRIRIERDMDAERRNLEMLLTHCMNHQIEFTSGLNAHLTTAQVLDLLAYVSTHADSVAVEWPDGERLKMHNAPAGGWNISLRPRGRWFEVEGEVHLDDNSVLTAQQLLGALANSHGGYVQLQNGDYLWLSERLRAQLDRLESLTTQESGHPAVPVMQTGLLAQLVHGEIDILCDGSFQDLNQRIERAEAMTPEVPETLLATLRPYQLEGFQWMMRLGAWGAGACLADDMGLGKTVQTIAFLLAHAHEGPALVIAPASVVPNWRAEMGRFAPMLKSYNIGEYYARERLVADAQPCDVLVATYGIMLPTAELLTSRQWSTVVLDEAHNIKNRGTKTSAAIMRLDAEHRIILTGTPVQNHLGELWNLFQFINPGLLGTYEHFNQKYIMPIENQQDDERQKQLQTLVSPFMLRRTKQAVVQELPEKTEITLTVELTDDEMAFYEVIRRQAEERFREEGNQLSVNALAELTRLRRAACSAELADATWPGGSSKVNAFMELTQNIVDGGHSVLVFSQFTSFLHIVRRALDEARLPYLYLDGNLTMRQREQLVSDFQKGKCPIFLISLKAGGVGLNLTAANYVVHLDPWWNPAIEQQATDRAYRIGQKQAVTVYHLISHHTIEEKILRLHESKRALSDSILESADKNFKLTAKDMLEMLSNQF